MIHEKVIFTDEALAETIGRITFKNATLDFKWAFKFKPFYDLKVPSDYATCFQAGWLLWVEFERPDIETGRIGIGRGRNEVVEIGKHGATESSIIKTCWVLYEMIIKHEAMEGFKVDERRIFNPHTPVPVLIAAQAYVYWGTP